MTALIEEKTAAANKSLKQNKHECSKLDNFLMYCLTNIINIVAVFVQNFFFCCFLLHNIAGSD